MNPKRRELINALISGLNIQEDVYAIETVKEKTIFISEHEYLDFYQAVMTEKTFGNGVKAVIDVAERFKPVETDDIKIQAEELITLVRTMNDSVYQEHIKSGVRFGDLLNLVTFPSVSDDDMTILNSVKPHYNLKLLVLGVNHYATSLECLEAFKQAIIKSKDEALKIDNKVLRMIGK